MENDVSLVDIRKEEKLKANCDTYGIEYITSDPNETKAETNERHRQLQLAIKNKRQQQYKAQQSPGKKRPPPLDS